MAHPQLQKNKLLILVDGSSYLHRAFHALPALSTSDGQPTGAIYGVINMIRRLINDYDPKYIAIIFDTKGKTFRHHIYTEYKATRPPMNNDLQSQIKPLHDTIKAMGLNILAIEGIEADDIIGVLAKKFSRHDIDVLVATGDKDLAQIVNPKVTLVDTMTNSVLDEKGVEKKFGVPPEKIIDYLALIGDTSDNIPGVDNVGPKTALKWLKAYGSVENIIKHANEIEGKVGENLRGNLKQLALSQELVTIKDDLDLKVDLKDLLRQPEDKEKLIELFKRLEFRTWLEPLLNTHVPLKEKSYQLILEESQFKTWLHKLQKATAFAIDVETTDLKFMEAKLVGISFATTPGEAAYLPLQHDYEGAPRQLELEAVLQELKPVLEDPHKAKIGHNLKYDWHIFANYNIELNGIAYDTMLEPYVLQSTAERYDLDSLTLKHLGVKIMSFTDIAGKGSKQLKFNAIHLDQAFPYAAKDADMTLCLHEVFWPKISQDQKLTNVFKNIEMPLVPVLARMEHIGICIDADLLNKQSLNLEKRIDTLEKEAFNLAGKEFNLGSPKQLQEILFSKLQLPILEKTPTGQPSTAESVLQELALNYELPKLILEHRTLSKLKSTYTDSLPKQINSKTGRIHTSYNQAVTTTGRLSSTDPNLQNIPARSEEGRRIRQAFIAPPGYKLLSFDYSQIELRIMAHLSKDKGLLKALTQAEDIHKATAAEVLGIPLQNVTKEERQRAKAINFGLIYGMSAFGLSRQIGTDRETAQKYMNLYFEHYPGVKIYMEKAREDAKQHGFVETIYGRRLYVPDIRAQNFQRRTAAERAAINAPMQGSAADIMKMAMIAIDEWIRKENLDVKMLLQVHDELIFEIADNDVEKAKTTILDLMQNVTQLMVPIIVHVGIGQNWDEAH